MMVIITQGALEKLRVQMFSGMQNLPIRFFDTHGHGDIMSYYTNDIDTLRQMLSQSFPQMLMSVVIVLSILGIMLYYSFWLTPAGGGGRYLHDAHHKPGGRQFGAVFRAPAGIDWPCRGVCRGDDERAEGH